MHHFSKESWLPLEGVVSLFFGGEPWEGQSVFGHLPLICLTVGPALVTVVCFFLSHEPPTRMPVGARGGWRGFIERVARQLRCRFLFARSNHFCRVDAGALRQLGNVADAIDLSPTGLQSTLCRLRELCSLLHLRPRFV